MSFQDAKRGELKMKKKNRNQKEVDKFSEEYIKTHRKFPVKNTVIIAFCIVAQIILGIVALTMEVEPIDVIENYTVTVEPLEDGTLDIEYSVLWKALDSMEDLTWVDIGLPNEHFSVYKDSLSEKIMDYYNINEDGYTGVQLDFTKGYGYGETVEFSFKVNQRNMLCKDADCYFYEFIPNWFNSIPVEKYEFRWKKSDLCIAAQGARETQDYYIWTGSLGCGEYKTMSVLYDLNAFNNAQTVDYIPFSADGAYNELEEERVLNIVLCCVVIVVLLGVEIYLLDSHVSYHRGRGFLRGYGHPIHIYGGQNPVYVRAYNRAHPNSGHTSGGYRGGGCACACACACAGGGRAGCSQKDTYTNVEAEK